MILTVDVGNSNIVLGAIQENEILFEARLRTDSTKTSDEYCIDLKMLLDGLKMIHGEFDRAFQELGVECIDAVGKDFDPNVHEAVSQEASDTVPAGKVIRQWNCGYKTGSRLLKPAMVVVSSGKPEEAGKE